MKTLFETDRDGEGVQSVRHFSLELASYYWRLASTFFSQHHQPWAKPKI